jgi:AsmA protein
MPVILLFLAALAIPALVDVNRYRPQIEARLEEQLGRDISLGPMSLTLIPLAFRVQNAVIAESPEFPTGQPFARTDALYVQPKLWPLLRRDIQIDSLSLNRPSVELVRNKNGTWNFSTLATHKGDGQPVSIDGVKIDDGQVAVTDMKRNTPRTVYDHIDLLLRDFAPNKSFSIEGRAQVSGAGEQTIVFNGKAGPLQHDGMAGTPFDGNLQMNEVSLQALQRALNVGVLTDSDGVLTGKAQISNKDGVFASNGRLEAQNPRVRGVNIGYPITVDYKVQGNLNDETVQIVKGNLNLGKTPIAVKGQVNAKPTPAVIDLNVAASNASLAEAARLAAAFGVAFNSDTKADGVLDLSIHAQGPADKPAMNGQAAARNLLISGGDLPQPVRVDRMELSLSPATIQSNQFTATTGGTNVQAQFTLSDYTSTSPQVKATVSAANAQVAEMLSIARAYGVSAVKSVKGSGTIQLNVAVTGPIKQTDKLTYSGSGALRNATLNLPSLAKPVAVNNADLRFNANSVILDNLDFGLGETVARGNLTLHNPAAPRVEFSLAADKVNVPEWQGLIRGPGSTQQSNLLQRLTGSGRITVNTVTYDDLLLTDVDSTVKMDKGVITINPIHADLFGGQQLGTVILDARNDPVTYNVNLKLQEVDANRLLSTISPIKDGLYGTLSASANTRFNSSGGARGIARSLDGRVSLNLHDGAIANMDLLHQMAEIAQFLSGNKTVEPDTKVSQLIGDFDIKDGVARTNNLTATVAGGSFAANGIIDLAQQKLNLRVMTVLSKSYSEVVGGTRIGGFMPTAVANENGELVIPMIVTGTFQDPQFAPDLQKIAELKLKRLLPNADNPAELGIGILERIFRDKDKGEDDTETREKPNQENQVPQLPDVLDKIFGGLEKKQRNKP